MNITKRLILTLSVALLALLFVSGYGFWQLRQSQARFAYVQGNIINSIIDLTSATAQMSEIRAATLARVLFSDDAQRKLRDDRIAVAYKNLDAIFDQYGKNYDLDETTKKMIEANRKNIVYYKSVQAKFVEQSMLPNADIPAILATLTPVTAIVTKGLKEQTDYNIKVAADLNDENTKAAKLSYWTLGGITALAFLLAGVLSIHLYRLIQRGLGNIQSTLQGVNASLDLTQRAPIERMDEIGHTASAFNGLMERIVHVLCAVRDSSDLVSVGAKQIAAGNIDLSARTEQQAASLEETVATMEELTIAIKKNSESARQADVLTTNASEIATKGHEVVSRVVDTMTEIDRSSVKIADITSVIEGIAFQTNILALNAAVEAARAGEQGRGFAVVASEVRNLAQRASSAAKEIKDLIEASVQKIDHGSTLASEAGKTMSEIMAAVTHVSEIMGEIAIASEEQSRGIEQVNQTITQMDMVTQQNAALVEEAAAAAKSLENQGQHLSDAVAEFHLIGVKDPLPNAISNVVQLNTIQKLESTQRLEAARVPLLKNSEGERKVV